MNARKRTLGERILMQTARYAFGDLVEIRSIKKSTLSVYNYTRLVATDRLG